MRYPILPAGAFTAAFLVLIPALWHWRAGNVPTLSLIAWLFTLNVVYGANSLAWSDNVWDKAPVWCDISAKLIIGACTALPACTFCICKSLTMIGGNRSVGLGDKDRRRILMFDFGFCWGIPILFMTLHYIVQGHRYSIVQYIGCQPTIYVSIPGIFIIWFPPLLLSVGTLVYAGLALYNYVQMRLVFSSVLQVSSSPMSTNRYMRLIAMAVTLVLWDTALTLITIWANTSDGLRPWISWEHVHSHWDRADAYVWILMSPQFRSLTLLIWWATPVSSIIIFIFLGFGEDALNEYRKVANVIMNTISPGALPKKNEKFGKGMLIGSPLPSSSSIFSKDLPPYSPNSSYVPSPTTTCVMERTSKLRDFILPLPVLTRTKTISESRVTSTVSTSDTLSSLKPPRPATRPRMTDSSFYFRSAVSHSMSNHSDITRFSMSDDHLAFGQVDGSSTPLPTNASTTNQAFQELPPIQPLGSLHTMMGLPHSKTGSQSPAKPNERRWSARSQKLRPTPLQLGSTEGRLRDGGMRTVTVAEPREALIRGSIQVTIQRREPHDQV